MHGLSVQYVDSGARSMMDTKFTRRRFLTWLSAGVTYVALANTVGCEPAERTSKAKPTTTSQPAQPGRAVAYGSQPAPQRGVWNFRSRPDLRPPVVEVSKKAHDTAPGYIFVAPEEGVASQGGSMIVDDRGEVVWFRPLQGRYGRAHDLKVQSYRGKSVLTWMDGVNEYVIFDHSYREMARFGAGHGRDGNHHEFLISPQDTALITVYSPVLRELSSSGGLKNGTLWQGIIQELDNESGEVLFEWHSLDHVGLDETYATVAQDGS